MTAVVKELRRAAALMRQRAEAARPVPVEVWAQYFSSSESAHFASWSPPVALAVADWLDAEARECERDAHGQYEAGTSALLALAVARAYLAGAP